MLDSQLTRSITRPDAAKVPSAGKPPGEIQTWLTNFQYIDYKSSYGGVEDGNNVNDPHAQVPLDGDVLWVKVWIWVGVITQTQHQQRTTKMCEWWFTSVVSREDVLRRGREDIRQQGDADRDTGYSWGTGAIEDEGDRCLDSSYRLGSVKVGIELTETEVAILHLGIGAAKGQGGSWRPEAMGDEGLAA